MAKKKFRKPARLTQQPAGTPPSAPPSPDTTTPAAAPSAKAPIAPTGDAVDSSDPILAKVQDGVRANLPPQFRVAVQRIVLAGMKVMFSPETHHLMLQAIQTDSDPAHAVGMGVTQLLTLLWKESKGTMPIPALVPAGILLCCEGLDFMEKSGMIKVTPDIVDNAVQTVTAYMMQKLGYTPQDMARIAQAPGAGGGQSPQQSPAGPQPTPAPQGAAPSQGLVQQQMGAQ